MQLDDDVGTDRRAQFRMKPEVRGEAAILHHVVGDLLLQSAHFLGSLEQGRVDLADTDKDYVVELLSKQTLYGGQSRQAQAVETVDQQHGGGRFRIARSGLLPDRREDLRQHVGLKL